MAKIKSVVYKCPKCENVFEEEAKDGAYRLGGICCVNDMSQMNIEEFKYEEPKVEKKTKK